MEKLRFKTLINASRDKVWKVLWDDKSYREWTSVFSPGSHAVSEWKEGSRVHFLDGSGNGMYSTIERMIPQKEMAFRHLGVIKDNQEQPVDEETKKWTGGMEVYYLAEKDKQTELMVDLDIIESFSEYMSKTFPPALEKVKELSENK